METTLSKQPSRTLTDNYIKGANIPKGSYIAFFYEATEENWDSFQLIFVKGKEGFTVGSVYCNKTVVNTDCVFTVTCAKNGYVVKTKGNILVAKSKYDLDEIITNMVERKVNATLELSDFHISQEEIDVMIQKINDLEAA